MVHWPQEVKNTQCYVIIIVSTDFTDNPHKGKDAVQLYTYMLTALVTSLFTYAAVPTNPEDRPTSVASTQTNFVYNEDRRQAWSI